MGHWACPPTATLPDGVHAYSVTATDAASHTSAPRTGSFDMQTATGSLNPPSSIKTTEHGTLDGTATQGATVNLYVDGEQVGRTTAGPGGFWSYTLPLLPAGEHHVSVGIENANGVEVYRTPEKPLWVSRPTPNEVDSVGCRQGGSSPAGLLALLLLAGLLRVRAQRGAAH